ncbi:MAG: hypothetical protein KDC78_12725 [Aequorivita sp.]|nr:hypothetical protein [Aequorivita sp.]
MKKSVLYIGIALLAILLQIVKDIYPTTTLILRYQLCTYEFQDIKENLQKKDLIVYTNEKELDTFFIQIKNSCCHKNQ